MTIALRSLPIRRGSPSVVQVPRAAPARPFGETLPEARQPRPARSIAPPAGETLRECNALHNCAGRHSQPCAGERPFQAARDRSIPRPNDTRGYAGRGRPVDGPGSARNRAPAAQTVGFRPQSNGESDPTLGPAGPDDSAAGAGFHANPETVRTRSPRLGRLIGAFHGRRRRLSVGGKKACY